LDGNAHLTAAEALQGDRREFRVTSLGRTVYALDGGGQVLWRARTGGPAYALAALPGGYVAVGDDAGQVLLLDPAGHRAWRQDLGSRVTALRQAGDSGLLAGGWDEQLTSFDAQGEIRWQASLDGPLTAIAWLTEASGQELAVASTLGGHLWAFGPRGSLAWQFRVGADAPAVALQAAGDGEPSYLLAGLQDGRLLALDRDGTLLWQQRLGQGAPAWDLVDLAASAGQEILVGSGGSEPSLALLSSQGDVLWRTALPSAATAVVATDLDGDGTPEIVAGLADGRVQAYDGAGRLRGVVHAGLPVWHLAAAPDGSLLALADVVAWRIVATAGEAGAPWLPPPATVSDPSWTLPAGSEAREGEAVLVFLGDVAMGRSMEFQLLRYGPGHPWAALTPLLAEEGVVAVANLESVLTTQGKALDKPYVIRAHPLMAGTLASGGFRVMSLANNHALDYGYEGLAETLSTLGGLGIGAVGAGASYDEAHRPAILTANGVRVAFLAYAAARWNGSQDVPSTERLAWAVTGQVQADVRAVRGQADLVVVLLHAGTEYASQPSADQVTVARAAVDAGADLVVGHHPHVTQTVERYGQGLIVYSLGDAVFDIPRPAAMRGELLRVHASSQGLERAELWPFWIADAIRPQLLDDGAGQPQYRAVYP
jgi:poly-gamma-glutamate capsule biosynthesis protein CapA/YwtB (metallophosphatase superfamily)/outer membrane protein assembly factor BamB